MLRSCLFLLSIFLFISCNTSSDPHDELGDVELSVQGAEAAQPLFKQGLLLLHSFEYVDARTAFDQAIAKDSNFVMAYWGKAMTYNQGLWHRQSLEDAQATLETLAPTPEERLAKATTELERDFLQATHLLYGEGTKQERDQAYANYMEQLHEKYPSNNEIAAFYALSLLSAVPYGRDEAAYEKGARVAQGIIEENPNHPGALHYLIHSYDDPKHAHLAKAAADSYSKVAPDAAHALHMPSHIYVALGRWEDVVNSNIASWEASVKRTERLELDTDAQSYHALHWLEYGLLQQGRFEEALKLLQEMQTYSAETESKTARSYLVRMKANYITETEQWLDSTQAIPVDLTDLSITIASAYHFLDGMAAFAKSDTAQLRQIILAMDEQRQLAQSKVVEGNAPMCAAGGWSNNDNNQLEIDQAQVMILELRGLYAQLQDDLESAAQWLQEATELETQISYSYGPPAIPKPSYELYGEFLLEQGQVEAAQQQFDKAIQRGPNRILALRGQVRAASALQNTDKVKELEAQLQQLLEGADPNAFGVNQQLSLR
ncbi:MAG: hypothetical protein AAF798_20580 [Bacteroidota bacterium]